jgi:hypothetical protein
VRYVGPAFACGARGCQSRQHADHARVVFLKQDVEPRVGTTVSGHTGSGRLQHDFVGGLHTSNPMATPGFVTEISRLTPARISPAVPADRGLAP